MTAESAGAGEVLPRVLKFSYFGGPLDGGRFLARAEPERVPLYRDDRGRPLGAFTAKDWQRPAGVLPLAGQRDVPHYVLSLEDGARYVWAPLAYGEGLWQ